MLSMGLAGSGDSVRSPGIDVALTQLGWSGNCFHPNAGNIPHELVMATEASSSLEPLSVVVVRAAALLCALPLGSVIETLRCPPLTAVSGAPECVAGVARFVAPRSQWSTSAACWERGRPQ
jgi:CheW-like protein